MSLRHYTAGALLEQGVDLRIAGATDSKNMIVSTGAAGMTNDKFAGIDGGVAAWDAGSMAAEVRLCKLDPELKELDFNSTLSFQTQVKHNNE